MTNIVRKNYDRVQPSHDYMKYWRVIRYWAKAKYKIGTPDIDMLFFLYSEQIFNKTKFKEFDCLKRGGYTYGVSVRVRKLPFMNYHTKVNA